MLLDKKEQNSFFFIHFFQILLDQHKGIISCVGTWCVGVLDKPVVVSLGSLLPYML